MVSESDNKSIQIWNTATNMERVLMGLSGRVSSVAFSHDGRHVASGFDNHSPRISNVAIRKTERVLEGRFDSLTAACVGLSKNHRLMTALWSML